MSNQRESGGHMSGRRATTVGGGASLLPLTGISWPAYSVSPSVPAERASATAKNPCVDPAANPDAPKRYVQSSYPCIPEKLILLSPQCSWGKDTAKKARTQQHYEALQNRIKTLEQRVKELEAEISGTHPSGDGTLPPEPGPSAYPNPINPSGGQYSGSSVYPKSEPDEYATENIHSPTSSNGDSDIEQLIAPTRNLVVSTNQNFDFPNIHPLIPDVPTASSRK